ncbi:MAG TPA: histidine kinase [Pyrinomonadaceae bacterium]|nr:histidine kinase [Pyrinomonadaceae bacterium]
MSAINLAGLINLAGYTLGIALYAMLLAMVLRLRVQTRSFSDSLRMESSNGLSVNGLLLATAVLGLLWNIGAFATYGLRGFGLPGTNPFVSAVSFTALGFLPAVVVHSVLLSRLSDKERRLTQVISIAAYCLSGTAGLLHFYDALVLGSGPSLWALRFLTFGYTGLLVVLFLATRRQVGWKKAVWASALAVFAVSALHLSHHTASRDPWFTELIGHHASLPLALAILYEDYRFAFADIFLKRALALLVLMGLAFGVYVALASPMLAVHDRQGHVDLRTVSALVLLWIITALMYPYLRRVVIWFVDAVMLRRADYSQLRSDVVQVMAEHEKPDQILDGICAVLAPALSAHEIDWREIVADESEATPSTWPTEIATVSRDSFVDDLANFQKLGDTAPLSEPFTDRCVTLLDRPSGNSALVYVPTSEPPYCAIIIGTLAGGRRLLSDDVAMLETVAVMVARRIDALRVTHERCEQNLREQEINKLATEAQLRALRAQVNPHFLFNALTTIGYLVQTAPDRALETLMKLTSLLRGVLRTDGEFVTLREELALIAAYLDIERARFEERLRVSVDVPEQLLSLRLPSLLLQPLVENAIKHGITPARFGGEVGIRARLEAFSPAVNGHGEVLSITVSDTGVGASEIELARGRRRGVGLSNIEQRLHCYGGQSASLCIKSTPGEGTVVELIMPVTGMDHLPVNAVVQSIKEKRKA